MVESVNMDFNKQNIVFIKKKKKSRHNASIGSEISLIEAAKPCKKKKKEI